MALSSSPSPLLNCGNDYFFFRCVSKPGARLSVTFIVSVIVSSRCGDTKSYISRLRNTLYAHMQLMIFGLASMLAEFLCAHKVCLAECTFALCTSKQSQQKKKLSRLFRVWNFFVALPKSSLLRTWGGSLKSNRIHKSSGSIEKSKVFLTLTLSLCLSLPFSSRNNERRLL